jgi:hypothetical protein
MRRNKTMTETRTEAGSLVPAGLAIGQAVGQAERVLTRLLSRVLAEIGTTRETYLALQRLSVHGDRAVLDDYVRDLSDWLGLDLWAAGELADGMLDAGLVALAGETVRLAPAGAELRERIRRSIGAVNGPLYAALDPADIETTVRTLQDITSRAREL